MGAPYNSLKSIIYKNGKKSTKNNYKNGKKYLDKPISLLYSTTMLPKNISLKTFQIIDNIAKSHQVTDAQWVEASGLKYVSRLSEIRSLSRGKYEGRGIDRIFSISKCVSLVDGLIKLVGGEIVRKELERALDKSKSNREIALLLTLSFPEESLEQLILYQKAHLNSIKPKKNKKDKS